MKATATATLALAALIALSACSGPAGRSGATSANDTAPTQSPQPALTLPPETPAPDPPISNSGPKAGTIAAKDQQNNPQQYSQEDCVMAAAGAASIMLVPSSFMYGADTEKLDELEAQLAQMRAKVPAELEREVKNLESVVERNRQDPEHFHSQEFRNAAQPVEDWLRENCNQ